MLPEVETPINRNESHGFASVFIQIQDPPLVALACPTSLPDPACSDQYGPPQTQCEWLTAVCMCVSASF